MVSVCEPTLVVVQVSKALTWLLVRGVLARDDRGRAGDDRACMIGAAASYVPRSPHSQHRIWTFTLDLPVGNKAHNAALLVLISGASKEVNIRI